MKPRHVREAQVFPASRLSERIVSRDGLSPAPRRHPFGELIQAATVDWRREGEVQRYEWCLNKLEASYLDDFVLVIRFSTPEIASSTI